MFLRLFVLSRRSCVCSLALTISLLALGGGALRAQPPAPTSAANALADQLIAAPQAADRAALLDANRAAVDEDLNRALSIKGLELRRQRRLDDAGRAFVAAREVAERRGDRVRAGNAWMNIASIPAQQADFPAAFAAIAEARAIAEELHDNDMLAGALDNQGIIQKLAGDFDGARETYQRSLALARLSHSEDTESRALNNLAVVDVIQGHYRDALDAYKQSLVIRERQGHAEDIALALNNIGEIYKQQRDNDLALEYFRRSFALDPGPAGDIPIGNIGYVLARGGRFAEARDSYRLALSRLESHQNPGGVAAMINNIASLDRSEGRDADALAGFRRSLTIREAISEKSGVSESLGDMAATLAHMKRFEEALPFAQRARDVAVEIKSNELLWQPLTVAGQIHQALGRLSEAERSYRDAIGVVEALRDEVAGGSASRQRFFENKVDAYTGLAGVLARQGRLREALGASEQARGRVLADMLATGQVSGGPVTPEEHAQQSRLEQAVVALTARASVLERRGPPGAPAIAEAAAKLRTARTESAAFRDALDARYPVRRLARGDVSAELLQSARALLPDSHGAILEYMVMPGSTFVFVATRGDAGDVTLQTFELPVEDTALAARVNRFRQKLASRALDFHADAQALYDVLLKPARAALAGRTRLVIIPDKSLWTIPFETLEPAPGRTVLDDASVSYAPSIAVLRAMHERRAALDAVGGLPRVVIAADPASDLPKMPEAQRQADALTALYGASRSRVFVGAEATEPRVRMAAAGATILHFATHGIVDGTNPMYSYLQLTRTGQVDAESDGRLEAWEVVSLKLDALVAVLTACDTARGKIGDGEGVVGLAWAFFAAGTPATVVSLWQLESGSATTLTLGLHQRLRTALLSGHGSVADSLRSAALELRRDPRYRHPYYWAGLVTVGDGY